MPEYILTEVLQLGYASFSHSIVRRYASWLSSRKQSTDKTIKNKMTSLNVYESGQKIERARVPACPVHAVLLSRMQLLLAACPAHVSLIFSRVLRDSIPRFVGP